MYGSEAGDIGDMDILQLPDELKRIRVDAKLSKAALGRELGVSGSAIGHYEARRRTVPPELVARWTEACGYSLNLHMVKVSATIDTEELRSAYLALGRDDRKLLEETLRNLPLVEEGAKKGIIRALTSLADETRKALHQDIED
jgi:transcriptional regulator with XRE-family HTH domain